MHSTLFFSRAFILALCLPLHSEGLILLTLKSAPQGKFNMPAAFLHVISFSSSPAYCSFQIILLILCSSHVCSPPLCAFMPCTIFSSAAAFFLSDVSNWATQISLTSLSEELSHAGFRLWKQFLYIHSLGQELTLTVRIFLCRIETNKTNHIT